MTVRLAREFGFCWGGAGRRRYAYQARRKFPERRVFLAGEIIRPHVNDRLRAMGITILTPNASTGADARSTTPKSALTTVIILSVRSDDPRLRGALRALGCVVVDDLRLGAERLEARRSVRPRRLHGPDSRQALP
ncbi:MAG: hypothetical protein U0163_15315 [Gemmatimonadaceae bacterium]